MIQNTEVHCNTIVKNALTNLITKKLVATNSIEKCFVILCDSIKSNEVIRSRNTSLFFANGPF